MADKDSTSANSNAIEYKIKYQSNSNKLWISLLAVAILTVMSLLSNSTLTLSGNTNVFVFYINIVVIMVWTRCFKFWGVLVSVLTQILYCCAVNPGLYISTFIVLANFVQSLIFVFVFHFVHFRIKVDTITLNIFRILRLFASVMLLICSFLFATINPLILLGIFSSVIVILYILDAIIEKNSNMLFYLFAICILPSLIGGILGAMYSINDRYAFLNIMGTWLGSNFVLLSTLGYEILTLVNNKIKNIKKEQEKNQQEELPPPPPKTINSAQNTDKKKTLYSIKGKFSEFFSLSNKPVQEIKVSTILFFLSVIVWNSLFYLFYWYGFIAEKTITYIFPWLIGNFFFIINMIFTRVDEITDTHGAFKWFEERAVVAEKNTQMLVAVIAFLLPICSTLIDNIPQGVSLIFILNITCAVISIGLIWVPKNNIRFMALVKNLKTLFHLFTVSLLLLNSIMIINFAL